MSVYPAAVLSLLADLEQATTAVIEKHFAADEARPSLEQRLTDWGPFSVRVFAEGADGQIAEFIEEGVNLP